MIGLSLLMLQGPPVPGGDWSAVMSFHGLEAGIQFSNAIEYVADLDGDHVPEILIGARNSYRAHPAGGAAFLYSGRTGRLIFDWYGESQSAGFGDDVARSGDVNADGYDDILVGAPHAWVDGYLRGAVYIFSGKDGHRLARITGNPRSAGGDFGRSVSALDDVNHDGCADFLISAPFWDVYPGAGGAIWIISGRDFSIIRPLYSQGDYLIGSNLLRISDLDGDQVSDVVTANELNTVLYSGATGHEIRRHSPPLFFESFGSALCEVGDVDGDGLAEYAIGAPSNSTDDKYGHVYLYSGATGALMHSWWGYRRDSDFGGNLAGPGDLDGDGFPELLIGADRHRDANSAFVGAVYLYSTFDFRLMSEFIGVAPDQRSIGKSLAASIRAQPEAERTFSIGSSSDSHGLIANGVVRTYALDSFLDLRPGTLSAAAGGPIGLELDFPASEAGKRYSILVSSGTGRFRVGDVWLPLGRTPILTRSAFAAPGAFRNQHGTLDFQGKARAGFTIPPAAAAPFVGRTLKFCALTLDPAGGVSLHSAAMPLTIEP